MVHTVRSKFASAAASNFVSVGVVSTSGHGSQGGTSLPSDSQEIVLDLDQQVIVNGIKIFLQQESQTTRPLISVKVAGPFHDNEDDKDDNNNNSNNDNCCVTLFGCSPLKASSLVHHAIEQKVNVVRCVRKTRLRDHSWSECEKNCSNVVPVFALCGIHALD